MIGGSLKKDCVSMETMNHNPSQLIYDEINVP